MGTDAVVVEQLSKKYDLVTAKSRHDTLRDHLAYGLKSFFRRSGNQRGSDECFWALKDVSFKVGQGEVVGVIGRTGRGRARCSRSCRESPIRRLVLPRSTGASASLLEVGTGFQPELSGRENIYLSGAILGMRKAEINSRFDEIVDFSGVEKFIETPVKRYSSGMYVRLAFAVAAHLEPEVMFIDEVLAVGDVGFQRKCLAKMDDVARGGRTILFVSHNLAAVRSLCPRSLFLRGGIVEQDGPSDELISKYLAGSEADQPLERRDQDRSGPECYRYS